MSSKIGGLDTTPVQVGSGRTVQKSGDVASATPSTVAAETNDVHITGSARQLAQLEQHLQSLPAIDSKRVAQVSSAIESGQYQFNAGRVADKMLSLENDLDQLHAGK